MLGKKQALKLSPSNKLVYYFLILSFLSSCFSSEKNQEILSRPHGKIKPGPKGLKSLSLISVFNFQKEISIQKEYTPKSFPPDYPPFINRSGAHILSSYIEIIKKKLPTQSLFINLGPTLGVHQSEKDQKILSIVKKISFDLIALSFNEVLFRQVFKKAWDQFSLPFVSSNILKISTQRPITGKQVKPYSIIQKNGLKIGFIQLSDPKKMPKEIQSKISNVYYQEMAASFLRVKRDIDRQKVDYLILSLNMKSNCSAHFYSENKNFNDLEEIDCPKDDPFIHFIKKVKTQSVDLIYLSGPKSMGVSKIKETPVIIGEGGESLIYQTDIFFDEENHEFMPHRTSFKSPIKLCHRFFASTLDCFIGTKRNQKREDILRRSSFEMIPAIFLGHEIKPDLQIETILNHR